MRKILSSLLVVALTFGCCEPCLVYGAAEVEQDQSTIEQKDTEIDKSAQEKEVKKLKQKLKEHALKQFKEIDKIKHMSNPRYFLYKLGKYLGTFLLVALGVGVPVASFICGKKFGFSKGAELSSDDYGKGYAVGFTEGNREYDSKHWRGEGAPTEVEVDRLLTLAKRILPYEAFKRYDIFYKNGTKVDDFYKNSGIEKLWSRFNDLQNNILQKKQLQNFDHSKNYFKDYYEYYYSKLFEFFNNLFKF